MRNSAIQKRKQNLAFQIFYPEISEKQNQNNFSN